MKNIIQYILLVTMISLSSCNDFLEESSQDEVIPSSIEDLDQLLAYEGYPRSAISLMPYLFLLDDDVEQYMTTSTNTQNQTEVFSYIYLWGGRGSSDNTTMFDDCKEIMPKANRKIELDSYKAFYKLIAGCNVVLDLIDEVTGEENIKTRVKGEALVLRSFYYFNLINLYAYPYNAPNAPHGNSKGIPLKLTSEIAPTNIPCSNVSVVYDRIIKDIEEGITCLAKIEAKGSKYRIGTNAAHLLASRYYLFMENWGKVEEHTSALVDSYGGKLPIFDMTTINYPTQLNLFNSYTFPFFFKVDNSEILFFYATSNENALMNSSWISEAFQASTTLLSCFQSDDQRLNGYLCPRDGRRKSSKVGLIGSTFPFGSCLRLSEVYLNRAEAYIQLAKTGKNEYLTNAIDDLNKIRENRIRNYATQSWTTNMFNNNADTILEKCREERRREFCIESMRWFDLRRYGMKGFSHNIDESTVPGDEYTIQLETESPRWILPIMQEHKKNNPSLN